MKFYSQIDNFSKLGIKSLVAENSTTNPTSPVEGQIYWKSDTNVLFVYDGSGWITFYLNTVPLQSITAPTGDVSLNSNKITNLTTPSASTDAATKGYVDGVVQGLDIKPSVRVATTVTGTLATAFANGQTVDGITLATSDRILIKNQSSASENGIYTVNGSGAPTRALDMDAWTKVPGAFVFVEVGTANADSGWVSTADAGGTLNTTAITWAQFSNAGAYVGGNGLTLTGLTFDVNVDGSSIEINSDTLRVKALGITNAMLAGSIDLTSKVTGALPIANGGSGQTTAAAARVAFGAAGMFTATNATLVASTYSSSINHALGSTKPIVDFYEVSSGEKVVLDWKFIDTNNIQIRADIAVTSGAINVVVHA